jgi:WD40 repeat protein
MERFFYTVLLTIFLQKDCGIAVGVPHHRAIEFYSDDMEITRNYLLQMLAMSGLTGLLVRRLFALFNGNSNYIPPHVKHRLMMRIISSRHLPMKFSPQPSSLDLVSLRTRVFKYDQFYKALIIGNERGEIIIVFSDGRRITHKMSGYIKDVNIVSSDMVVVCNADNHAYIMRIANCGLIPFGRLGHENEVNSAHGDLSRNLFVSGSRDKSVKVWHVDQHGNSECLQTLTTDKVTKVLIHGDDSAHVIAFSTAYVKMYLVLISQDGKKVLSRKCLFAQDEGQVCIAFHPNPKKKILISGGLDGQIIVWRFQITFSNEILIENLVIELPNLKGYWTSSISIHHRLPIVLFCFADSNCEKLPNLTIAVVFSEDFKKVRYIMKLREGSRDGGSARAVFSNRGVLLFDYYSQAIMQLVNFKQ